jgi:uncharacterized protein (TIGR02147 family)
MKSIFEYDNYRHYLKDFVAWQRSFNDNFSLRYLAIKAGFRSHSFLHNVISGKRNLTLESIGKVCKAISLNRKESLYMRSLVLFNQSKTYQERDEALKDMSKIRQTIEFYRVQENQYAYYGQWYLPILREIAVYSDWKGDYRKLSQMVRPAISTEQAKQGIATLTEIGMLKSVGENRYIQTQQVVTAEEVPGYIFREARTQYMLRAMEAAESMPMTERHISYAVLAMSRKTFVEITRLLDEERKKALVMATEDEKIDAVYAINIQVFPLTAEFNPAKNAPKV